jgi:hypothetical protein
MNLYNECSAFKAKIQEVMDIRVCIKIQGNSAPLIFPPFLMGKVTPSSSQSHLFFVLVKTNLHFPQTNPPPWDGRGEAFGLIAGLKAKKSSECFALAGNGG